MDISLEGSTEKINNFWLEHPYFKSPLMEITLGLKLLYPKFVDTYIKLKS